MPIEILIVLVVVGVSGIVLAVHLTGGSMTAKLKNSQQVIDRFEEDYPDAGVEDVIITADGETAFLMLEGGDAGIVHTVGDKFLTRHTRWSTPRKTDVAGDATLLLSFDDFTWPGGRFEFGSTDERDRAMKMFDPEWKEEP